MIVNKVTITFLVFILLFKTTNSQVKESKINFSDSISVKKFIANSTLCEKIHFAQKNKAIFCRKKCGYSYLILGSITKSTKRQFFIPVYNHNIPESSENKQNFLNEQLEEVKKDFFCK